MSAIASVIKITAPLVHGDPPKWVRRGWFGCIMPCEPECGHIPTYVESVLPQKRRGLLTVEEFRMLRTGELKIDGFSVPTVIALQVLECHAPESAEWFYDHGYPKQDSCFRFKLGEVRVLRHLTEAECMRLGPMAVYDDLETGTMRQMS